MFAARTVAAVCLAVASLAATAAGPKAGDVPPDYVGLSLDKEPVLLSKYSGTAVVISFWATWCKYCLKELPVLNGIQEIGKGNVQVIAINIEERDVFRRVVRTLKDLKLALSYDPGHKARDAWSVNGIPHLVIIGRDGKVAGVHVGYGEDSLDGIVEDINRATGATGEAQP